MKRKIELNFYDIEMLKSVIERMNKAANVAENASVKTYGESNPSFEFGFMKGMVESNAMEFESILGLDKNK